MAQPVMKVLYGPPGTGKTRQAAREAVRAVRPDIGTIADDELRDLHEQLVTDGRVIWVTFHPSFTYEDFVEGLRPVVVPGTGVTYEARPGPFLRACRRVAQKPIFQIGQILDSSSGAKYKVIRVSPGEVIVENAKGKGKGNRTPVSLDVVRRLQQAGYKAGTISYSGGKTNEKAKVAAAVGVDEGTLFRNTGPLRAVWEHVEANAGLGGSSRVVIIIDEINRADLSRVFGELITLIEPDKRLGAPEERRVHLPYSGALFGVPAEVSIIGTMNTSDRSLALMDLALRRRFEFEEVPPDPSLCASPYAGIDLPALLQQWNGRITALLSREHRVGHSYLMPRNLERMREIHGFPNDQDGELRAVAAAVRESILPLLKEYFHDDWRKIDLVFGRDFSRKTAGLLTEVTFDDLAARASDVVDLSDVSDYDVPVFWDPTDAGWDATLFKAALQA